MKTQSPARSLRSPALRWSHCGTSHRVSVWPEVAFTARGVDEETSYAPDPASEVFASAAVMIDRATWNRFLEFMPARERDFIARFNTGRLAALTVCTRCPALLDDLIAAPALATFLAAHVALRGTGTPRWDEINAVFERGGIFSVLEWLGLPASRQTLTILAKIDDPDLPHRLLEPVRAALWEPEMIWVLQALDVLTERDLAVRCHALAA